MDFVSANASKGSCGDGFVNPLVCELGTLAVDESVTVEVTVIPQ